MERRPLQAHEPCWRTQGCSPATPCGPGLPAGRQGPPEGVGFVLRNPVVLSGPSPSRGPGTGLPRLFPRPDFRVASKQKGLGNSSDCATATQPLTVYLFRTECGGEPYRLRIRFASLQQRL